MKKKIRLLLCYLLICAIVPINLTFANDPIDRAGDNIHIDDIVYYLSQTGSIPNSDIRNLLDQIAPILPTPTPTPTPKGSPVGYTFCGNEGQTCSFSGTASVAYGAEGVYYYRTFTTSTPCNNEVFGDPIGGVAKSCYYLITTPVSTNVAAGLVPTSSSAAFKYPFYLTDGDKSTGNTFNLTKVNLWHKGWKKLL